MPQPARGWNSAGTDMLRFALIGLGGLCYVGGIGVTVLVLLTASATHLNVVETLTTILLVLGATVITGTILLAFAANLRLLAVQIRQQQLLQTTFEQVQQGVLLVEQAVREKPAATGYVPVAQPVPPPSYPTEAVEEAGPASQKMLDLLTQIRDLTMMDEKQRAQMAQREFEQRKAAIVHAVEREIDLGQWEQATQKIEELKALGPEDPIGQQLTLKVRDARQLCLTQDVEAARIQLRHLMSITAWPQAEEVITALVHKYPHAPEAQALAEEIRRERETFERENFQRLMLDLKDATDHKQWRRAIMVADELVRRYPDDPRVTRLRTMDLPTLKDNAEAQDRREQEAMFKDLLHRQRYEDAAAVARRVIEKYPTSQAALELAKLLPKVEELIRQDKLKRQQTPA